MTCQLNDKSCSVCPVKAYLGSLAVWNAKLHNIHWNVTGHAFVQVHEYTEKLYDEVFEQYDAVAEAMKMRGALPPVKLEEFVSLSVIEEAESREWTVPEAVAEVLSDMQKMRDLAEAIRNGADEKGEYLIVSQFEEYLAWYAKELWFLKAMSK